MRSSFYPVLAAVILSGVLWVIPSLGTQGMGTIGQRFAHVDRDLMSEATAAPGDRDSDAVRATLLHADAVVESAAGR
ncbi:hypothetical protein [Glacieibacterium sp.]|uniref:hypothetical protein n=1 Tax=Glacieibacterium sp. TaxID=2860237 RepID=UPI003B009DB0